MENMKLTKSYQLIRLAIRKQLDQKVKSRRLIARVPGVGPYYWVPTPSRDWELWAYVISRDMDIPDHQVYWREVVAPRVASVWDKTDIRSIHDIRRLTYSVPRGRVSFFDGFYYLNHGNDAPVSDWQDRVYGEYGLRALANSRPDRVKVYHDGHEQMLAADRS